MGGARGTQCDWLACHGPTRYERAAEDSIVDDVEPQIRGLLREFPTMPATAVRRADWLDVRSRCLGIGSG